MAEQMHIAGVTENGTVVCTECGCVSEPLTQQFKELREFLSVAQAQVTVERTKYLRLRRQIDEENRKSPHYQAAKRVMEHWKKMCLPSARELGGDRIAMVIARMEAGWSEEDLTTCVDGYARFPYVVNKQRAAKGSDSQWHAKATMMFRNADMVEQGVRLAKRVDNGNGNGHVELDSDVLAGLRQNAAQRLWT